MRQFETQTQPLGLRQAPWPKNLNQSCPLLQVLEEKTQHTGLPSQHSSRSQGDVSPIPSDSTHSRIDLGQS